MPSKEIYENQLSEPKIVCNRESNSMIQLENATSSSSSYLEWNDNHWSNEVADFDDVFSNIE